MTKAIAITQSGKRIAIVFTQVMPNDWRVYRQEEPYNWQITSGRKWGTLHEAVKSLEERGFSVEMDD
jgi:hypothetical protein